MCLNVCCGFLSLYIGCVAIGISGMIFSIVLFALALFHLVLQTKIKLALVIFAMATSLVHGLSMALLLIGVMLDVCWTIFLSFVIGIFSTVLLIASLAVLFLETANPVHLVLGVILVLVQIYFLWIIISTWWCCRSCRNDC
ncbi:uncharacterized protein Dana_GF12943 [Drosophila ananassae]|uniref:Uncharacterized protein n=1 Tax=Drosophila ananassae TaxID=7217 RepID=B3MDF5_DROAN|nr:uncharacterized protein LOC6495787 [Drosophila ananassae]EDV36403.2 uncharacterized protein Dana_GF12943 [Drosophila ananassae]KAH8353975.1 hypothetical protein KR067_007198 [Drosophila pandora]